MRGRGTADPRRRDACAPARDCQDPPRAPLVVGLDTWLEFRKAGAQGAYSLAPLTYGDSYEPTGRWWRLPTKKNQVYNTNPNASWMQPLYDHDSNTYTRLSATGTKRGVLSDDRYTDMQGRGWCIGWKSVVPVSDGPSTGAPWYLVRKKKVQKAILACETARDRSEVGF